MIASREPGTVTHAAHVAQNRETGNVEVVVVRDTVAGICGPAADFELADRTIAVEALSIELNRHGFRVTGEWIVGTSYRGMTLTAEVTPL